MTISRVPTNAAGAPRPFHRPAAAKPSCASLNLASSSWTTSGLAAEGWTVKSRTQPLQAAAVGEAFHFGRNAASQEVAQGPHCFVQDSPLSESLDISTLDGEAELSSQPPAAAETDAPPALPHLAGLFVQSTGATLPSRSTDVLPQNYQSLESSLSATATLEALTGSTNRQLTWQTQPVNGQKQLPAIADTLGQCSLDAAAEADPSAGVPRLSGSLQGMVLLNISALLFGSNQVVIKMTEEAMNPNALSALRFSIAALCFAPAILKGLRKPELRNAAVELGLWLFGGYTAQAVGLMQTTAARGAFTGTFTVVAVPLLVGLSGRRVPWTTWMASVVALAGVGLLTSSGTEPNLGDALCILSATLFGVHKWRSEAVTARFEETHELIAVQLGVLAATSVLVCIPGLLHVVQDGQVSQVLASASSLPWVSIAYMGLATTAFTLWTEMNALKTVSAPLAALIYTAEPLWGALFAWGLLGERWGPSGWLGAGLIVGASLASQLVGETKEKLV